MNNNQETGLRMMEIAEKLRKDPSFPLPEEDAINEIAKRSGMPIKTRGQIAKALHFVGAKLKEEGDLAEAWDNYTNPDHPEYDPVFAAKYTEITGMDRSQHLIAEYQEGASGKTNPS